MICQPIVCQWDVVKHTRCSFIFSFYQIPIKNNIGQGERRQRRITQMNADSSFPFKKNVFCESLRSLCSFHLPIMM